MQLIAKKINLLLKNINSVYRINLLLEKVNLVPKNQSTTKKKIWISAENKN